MINIHLIPTVKDSCLAIVEGRLEFDLYVPYTHGRGIEDIFIDTQHVYITSDEEIIHGDFVILKSGRLCQAQTNSGTLGFNSIDSVAFLYFQEGDKKVVLTTDQDLIKDGVQYLGEAFLEWFVKNPDQEVIEVIQMLQTRHGVEWHDLPNQTSGRDPEGIYRTIYKVIIPQNTKQVIKSTTIIPNPSWGKVLEAFQEKGTIRIDTPSSESFRKILDALNAKYVTQEDGKDLTRFTLVKEESTKENYTDKFPSFDGTNQISTKEEIPSTINIIRGKVEEAKKQQYKYDNLHDAKEISSRIKEIETFEKAAKSEAFEFRVDYKPFETDLDYKEYAEYGFEKGFIQGAKWQQERSYSEEDVLDVNNWYLETFLDDSLGLNGKDAEQKVKHLSGKGLTKEVLNYWFEQFKKK